MKNQKRATAWLFTAWFYAFLFIAPRALQAASFSQDMKAYDYMSLLWGLGVGLLGGVARTLVSLSSDKEVVDHVGKELLKDALVSLIAGGACFVIVEAVIATHWATVPSELRLLLIGMAGWARTGFFGKVNDKVGAVIDEVTDAIKARIKGTTS